MHVVCTGWVLSLGQGITLFQHAWMLQDSKIAWVAKAQVVDDHVV
jgi:hypothetical protein